MRRFVQAFSETDSWPDHWEAGVRHTLADAQAHYNIGPTDDAWIVLKGEHGLTAQRFRWGLVPPWSKEPSTKYTTITARLDRASRSRIFGRPWKSQHCLVPMTGYYKLDRSVKPPAPHLIQRADGQPLLAAGLWERWDKEDVLCSFSILTHSNPAIPPPLTPDGPVFTSGSVAKRWLDGPQLLAGTFLRLAPLQELTSYPVSMRYRDRARDDYTLLEPASASDYLMPMPSDEEEEDD